MTLNDILRDPSFAGLHWSIPRDTLIDDRETAHVSAAMHAHRKREVARLRTHTGPYDHLTRVWLCCGLSDVEIAATRPYCAEALRRSPSQETT